MVIRVLISSDKQNYANMNLGNSVKNIGMSYIYQKYLILSSQNNKNNFQRKIISLNIFNTIFLENLNLNHKNLVDLKRTKEKNLSIIQNFHAFLIEPK